MVRIAVDLTGVKSIGTRGYASGFMPALAAAAGEDRLRIWASPSIAGLLRPLLPARVEIESVRGVGGAPARLAWQQSWLPHRLRRLEAEVLLAPMEFAPFRSPCPVVLAIHNPSPHLDHRLASRARRALSTASARHAARVVFVSRWSADTLGGRLGVPESKRCVIPHGTDLARWTAPTDPRVLDRYGVAPGGYVLYVSQLYRYKDPGTLLEAFARWRRSSGRTDQRLLLTGTVIERGFDQELQALADRLGIAPVTRFLGHVPAGDLPALYRYAAVFALPTRVETFGQPFLEAMASGVPVVAADIEVAREVCAEAAAYFPPGDAAALAGELERALDPAERAAREARGRARAAAFSFAREAERTMDLLREVRRS